MKVKDKGMLWNFLREKASEKLQQEQNSLVQLDAKINSIEINLEKMSEMKAMYRDQLNSGLQRMLSANRIRLVQNFIARLDDAAQMAKEQKGRFRAVIPGEDYNAFNKDAVSMRSELSNKSDRDFNNRNPGVTIFWL